VNARLLVRRQKMHGSQRCCGELVELTVDDIWQIAGAGDQQLQRLAHSSRRDTLELSAEDNDGLSQQTFEVLIALYKSTFTYLLTYLLTYA